MNGRSLFFVTFGTRDRKAIRSLEIGHRAFVRYGVRASEELSLAIGLGDVPLSCHVERSRDISDYCRE